MQLKQFFALALTLAAGVVFGQQGSVTVTFPDAGDRDVWIGRGLPDKPPGADSKEFHSVTADVPAIGAKPTDAVFVWDHKTGNLASKAVKDAASGGGWIVKPEDVHDVAQVKIHVEQDNKPVSAAIVLLQDARRTQQQLVDASSQGDAVFFMVKPGSLKVTVQYKSKGVAAKPVTQILDAPLERADIVPGLVVSLPEPTETISAAVAAPPGQPSPGPGLAGGAATKPAPPASAAGSIIAYVLGLAVAVGLGILIVQYFKSSGSSVAAKLEQLGVQIPKPGDDGLTNPANLAAPTPSPKPAAPQKIILDNAAPNILGTDPMANPIGAPSFIPAPTMGGVSGPKLLSSSGDSIPVSEGDMVVGRDAGLGLSLVGESTISRRHAQLVRNGTTVLVRDLGSTNGTFVNGMKVSQDTTLRPGDHVQFGAVQFRYEG